MYQVAELSFAKSPQARQRGIEGNQVYSELFVGCAFFSGVLADDVHAYWLACGHAEPWVLVVDYDLVVLWHFLWLKRVYPVSGSAWDLDCFGRNYFVELVGNHFAPWPWACAQNSSSRLVS